MPSIIRFFTRTVLLLGFSVGFFAHAQTPEKIGTGTISGKVTIEGKPAPGIVVLINKDTERWEQNKPATKATTDASGVFKLEKLSAAKYYLSASAPGYYDAKKKSEWDNGTQVNLGEGEQADGINFALTRGAVVTGRLFDDRGHKVIEETIVLIKQGREGQKKTVTCSDTSDDRGVFRCYGLEPGKYIVGAGTDSKEGNLQLYASISYTRTWYPGVAEEDKAKVIEVKIEEETAGIDIKLSHKKKGYKVLAKIIDANTGKPVPNMLIGIGTANEEGLVTDFTFGSGSISNSEGDVKIEGLTTGHYVLVPNAMQSGEYFGEQIKVEIKDEDITGLEMKVEKGAIISGTAILADGVNQEIQKKLSSLSLIASSNAPKSDDWYASTRSASLIGAAGNVEFKGVRTGRVRFNLNGNEAKGFVISRIERDSSPLNDGLEVKAGEQVSGVRIVLAYGSATIRGEIKVEGGTLPDDVGLGIQAKPAGTQGQNMYGSVDSRGRFVIEGLGAGSYDLVVNTYSSKTSSSISLQKNSKTVQVTQGQESTVNLTVSIGGKDSREEK